jgi:hypothetical protein
MKATIIKRVFIVGCPRSGTTLLQSLVAANSNVASFPESHFYEKLFSGKPFLSILGIASRRARPRWKKFLEEIDHLELDHELSRFAFTTSQFSAAFIRVLDILTQTQGKTIWVEKTPGHLHFLDEITRLVKDARFVHILRNGADVVASLHEIGRRYANFWVSNYNSIDRCIQRWVEDTRLSIQYATDKNHFLVRYESLIADPRRELIKLCSFLDLPFEENMLTDYTRAAKHVILKNEPWKAGVDRPIAIANHSKFHTLFNENQRQYILQNLPTDLLPIGPV